MSAWISGAASAAEEILTGIVIFGGLSAVAALAIAGMGWLLFQFVKTCTRNLVRGGEGR